MNTYNKSDSVKILSSRHPDVIAGTLGQIDCFFEGGYGVKIHGAWIIAGSDRGACVTESRVMWYPIGELEAQTLGNYATNNHNGNSDKK